MTSAATKFFSVNEDTSQIHLECTQKKNNNKKAPSSRYVVTNSLVS